MSKPISSYQQYLPATLQEDAIVGGFLQAFEQILSGNTTENESANESAHPLGLEEIINGIHLYFNPRQTPEEFLPWLAGWVALSIRDDWKVEVKREFIQQIVKLYRLRGTKEGLTQVLQLYLTNSGFGDNVKIFDRFDHFPDYFQVQLTLNDRDPEKYWRQVKIAKAIIDQEKPAHTFYTLKILVPTMQITKRSLASYPFKLFGTPQTQEFTLEVAITANQISTDKIPAIAKQIAVQIQGDLQKIAPYAPKITTNNQTISVKQKITYQQFLDNFSKFNIILSNRTDNLLVGNLAVNLYFNLNGKEYSNQLLSQSLSLLPVLKICRKDNSGQVIEGNTIIKQAQEPQRSGMQITQAMWTEPYRFNLFDLPADQTLELEAVVEINQPQVITSELTNKITVRIQDNNSKFYLLTPNIAINDNTIKITRQLNYQQFLQTVDSLKLVVKNLNNVAVIGKVSVQVTMNINQRLSSFQLFQEDLNLAAVPLKNILQICYKDENGNVVTNIKEPILTIIGTT
jgi:phage tail-like protein